MENFDDIQNKLNKEFAQRKKDELKTPEGIKKFISGKVGNFVNKLMLNKRYQITLVFIFLYLFIQGLIHAIIDIYTWKTVVSITIYLFVIYWSKIKFVLNKIKLFIFLLKIDISCMFFYITNYFHGIFRRKR